MTERMTRTSAGPGRRPPLRRTCRIRLFDRLTGAPYRINGAEFAVLTRDPVAAVRMLMEYRDRNAWEARVEPVGVPAARP